MEKETGVKKNTNSNGEISIPTSSSASSMEMSDGSNHTTESEIDGGNANKKMNRDELSNSPGQVEAGPSQGQGSEVKGTSMDNLPPEMLTTIFKYVDTQNLFKCRLVNRNWCAISSEILTNRSNAGIRFELNSINEYMWHDTQKGHRSLKQFLITMKKTKNNPYSRFTCSVTEFSSQAEVFDHKDFKEFLSDFASSNQRIKSLAFVCDDVMSMEKLQFFTAKFADLLLNKVPCLEELALLFPRESEASVVKLFPTPQQEDPESGNNSNTKTNEDQIPFPAQPQLAQLKVLHFVNTMISHYPEIVKDLLNAAVNLSWFRASVNNSEDLHVLHSLGKFHLLREAQIDIDETFFSSVKSDKNPNPLPLPKLENLDLKMSLIECDEFFFPPATIFLANLFESCKETLQVLSVQPLGFSSTLQLPIFKNLRKLRIQQLYTSSLDSEQRVFPSGVRSRDIFPAVTELDLAVRSWSDAFPQEDSIPLFPRVTTLNLKNRDYNATTISKLALMCPNLKKLKIQNYGDDPENDDEFDDDEYDEYKHKTPPQLNFLRVGGSIWTHMTQLESLEVDIDVDEPGHVSECLDSCFTGISLLNVFRIYEITKTGKKSKKSQNGKSQHKLEDLLVKEGPSILDMKDLKRLIINPYKGKKLLDRKKEFYSKKLTWISEEYAFKHMPHLKLYDD